MPFFLGVVPQTYWLYGNLDYSFKKYHRHYQAHDDWYPDRKNKTLGHRQGGQCSPIMKTSKYLTLVPQFIPRGCHREIRKYQVCASKNGAENCTNDKVSIMEVCPDHILEGLREKKKWYMRAEMIDNDTYRRAMEVSDFNKGKSVSELKLKTWAYGTSDNLRSDSVYQDNRWNPTEFSHNHRYDNVNYPEQEYKDFFGGTMGEAEAKDYQKHKLGLVSGESQAMQEHRATKRIQKLRGAVQEVNELNKED